MSSRKRSNDPNTPTPNKPSEEEFEFKITTRKRRTKVQCFCNKCNGKLVDPRTKRSHEKLASESSIEEAHSPTISPAPETHSPIILPAADLSSEPPMKQVFIERHSTHIVPEYEE